MPLSGDFLALNKLKVARRSISSGRPSKSFRRGLGGNSCFLKSAMIASRIHCSRFVLTVLVDGWRMSMVGPCLGVASSLWLSRSTCSLTPASANAPTSAKTGPGKGALVEPAATFSAILVMSLKKLSHRSADFLNSLRVFRTVLEIKAPHGSSREASLKIAETISPQRSSRFLPIVVDMSLLRNWPSLCAAGRVQVEQASRRGRATALHPCFLSESAVSVFRILSAPFTAWLTRLLAKKLFPL